MTRDVVEIEAAISEVTGGMRKIEPTTSARPPNHSMVVSIQCGHSTKMTEQAFEHDDEEREQPDGKAHAFRARRGTAA